jgi:hypothetical protein
MAPKRTDSEEDREDNDQRSQLRKYGDEHVLTVSMRRKRDADRTNGREKPEARVAGLSTHPSSPGPLQEFAPAPFVEICEHAAILKSYQAALPL